MRRVSMMMVASAVATLADYALASSLVHGMAQSVWLSTALGCALGAVVNYLLNRWFTFHSEQAKAPEFLRYLLVSGSSLILNSIGVSLLNASLRPWLSARAYDLSWLIIRVVIFYFWNIRLQTEYVFGRRAAKAPSPASRT